MACLKYTDLGLQQLNSLAATQTSATRLVSLDYNSQLYLSPELMQIFKGSKQSEPEKASASYLQQWQQQDFYALCLVAFCFITHRNRPQEEWSQNPSEVRVQLENFLKANFDFASSAILKLLDEISGRVSRFVATLQSAIVGLLEGYNKKTTQKLLSEYRLLHTVAQPSGRSGRPLPFSARNARNACNTCNTCNTCNAPKWPHTLAHTAPRTATGTHSRTRPRALKFHRGGTQ